MGKIRKYGLLILLIILFVGYIAVTTTSIVTYSEKDETQTADVAIVLGASVVDSEPSPVYRERINHAIKLYNDGYVRTMIVTGGIGEGNVRSDADIAREYAQSHGIPQDAIFAEDRSTITAENLENAKAIMTENNMDTALIVSDPLHMKRAMLLARDLGINAYSSPTMTTLYRSWRTKLPFLAREEFYYVGYRLYRLFK